MSARAESPQSLFLIRIPGPHGPTLICRGELTLGTSEGLRRELALLGSAPHRGLVLDLTEATVCDPAAWRVMTEAAERLAGYGGRFVVIPGPHPAPAGGALQLAPDAAAAAALLAAE